MRTIKFRGKRLDGQGWVYGSLWGGANHSFVTPANFGIGFSKSTHFIEAYAYEVIPESVGQWTGLVDGHGKEIFEGDVVKAENTQNVGEIKYVHEHGSFLVYSHDENGAYYEYLDIGLCEKYFEVIGSIHDNPELMEV